MANQNPNQEQDAGLHQNQNAGRGRGFASMDEDKQRAIASMGGRASHASGNAHEFDSHEAREAGRKGGQAVSRNREHMSRIGAKGGQASGNRSARGGGNGSAQERPDGNH